MSVTWVFNNLNKKTVQKGKTVSQKESCFTLVPTDQSNLSKTYIFCGNPKQIKIKSWNVAEKICSTLGGSLPYFTSREDLHDLINILKYTSYIPPMEGIFIGLKQDYNGVRDFIQ